MAKNKLSWNYKTKTWQWEDKGIMRLLKGGERSCLSKLEAEKNPVYSQVFRTCPKSLLFSSKRAYCLVRSFFKI